MQRNGGGRKKYCENSLLIQLSQSKQINPEDFYNEFLREKQVENLELQSLVKDTKERKILSEERHNLVKDENTIIKERNTTFKRKTEAATLRKEKTSSTRKDPLDEENRGLLKSFVHEIKLEEEMGK